MSDMTILIIGAILVLWHMQRAEKPDNGSGVLPTNTSKKDDSSNNSLFGWFF